MNSPLRITAVQSIVVAPFPAQFGMSHDGIGANGWAPPDTVGEAGPNDYVQWVNVLFAVFDKIDRSNASWLPEAGQHDLGGLRR